MSMPRFLPFGDAALLVEFGATVDRRVSETVMALDGCVREAGLPGLVETVPSFRSLMVQFDPLVTDFDTMAGEIGDLVGDLRPRARGRRRLTLPVCYEGAFAPDLDEVAAAAGLSAAQVVDRHRGLEHYVYMIGFLPGLPYMGDLPEDLTLPRRPNPRLKVPRGAVGIAMGLTVIYPVDSPGGWHLIGRSPAQMFDLDSEAPALLTPGDRVRFEPVSVPEYERILVAVAAGSWRPPMESLP